MGLEKDVFYESRGRVVHPTWPKNFEDHETRLKRAWRRCSGAFGTLERTIASYLLTDGRIPGPLKGTSYRQQELRTSKLDPPSQIDLRLGIGVFLRLEADVTLIVVGPALGRGETVHCQICLQQDDTGGRLVTWPANVLFPDDTPPTLATDPEAVDIIHGTFDGTRSVLRVAGMLSYSE